MTTNKRSSEVVGCVPRFLSLICMIFIQRGGKIVCRITGTKCYSADLPHGGMDRHVARGFKGFNWTPFCNILSLTCGQIHWMVQIEDLVSVSTIIPLVSFHYWHVIFTGGCNSSTYEPTVANPRANWTPLHESLVTCLLQLLIRQTWSSYSV